ncbi:MAG TPA: DUF3050 domain-containing protein [Sulfuricaulis sp.]|nr:DUF3050 domain-containing protein [Sulfuricaulis sp.]
MSKVLSKTGFVSSRHNSLRENLTRHPLYDAIHNEKNLRVFMEHHVYAVWDFMSLIKSLQMHIAPTNLPWVPPKNSRYANFINRLVLDEESDHVLTNADGSTHTSHFEVYRQAMLETGADIHPISRFVNIVGDKGLETALQTVDIPTPAKRFMAFTFDIIGRNQLHLLAATLAYGREILIPQLFRSLLEGIQISRSNAPNLYSYFERHIQIDEQEHGPLAVLMVQELCEGSAEKQAEVMDVVEQALAARPDFWNGIYEVLSV